MIDLCMTYLGGPGVNKPELDALFTNQFAGKIKLTAAQWAQVHTQVAEFDKVFS